jgi:hypothetical protein
MSSIRHNARLYSLSREIGGPVLQVVELGQQSYFLFFQDSVVTVGKK